MKHNLSNHAPLGVHDVDHSNLILIPRICSYRILVFHVECCIMKPRPGLRVNTVLSRLTFRLQILRDALLHCPQSLAEGLTASGNA
jgi:hypothetical protein